MLAKKKSLQQTVGIQLFTAALSYQNLLVLFKLFFYV